MLKNQEAHSPRHKTIILLSPNNMHDGVLLLVEFRGSRVYRYTNDANKRRKMADALLEIVVDASFGK